MKKAPKLVEIIAAVPEEQRETLLPRLKVKPVRTASGIAVVAVMSKPHRCPHIATTGNICIYCPGGPDSDFEYSTQSYTGYEPTSMRAIRARCCSPCLHGRWHCRGKARPQVASGIHTTFIHCLRRAQRVCRRQEPAGITPLCKRGGGWIS